MSGVITELNDRNFEEQVLKSDQVWLVDFWAPWCGPCLMMAPTLEEIAKDLEGKLRVGKLNVDENPETTSKYGIRAIPTLILFKAGKEIAQAVGVQPKEELISFINQNS